MKNWKTGRERRANEISERAMPQKEAAEGKYATVSQLQRLKFQGENRKSGQEDQKKRRMDRRQKRRIAVLIRSQGEPGKDTKGHVCATPEPVLSYTGEKRRRKTKGQKNRLEPRQLGLSLDYFGA